MAEAVAGVTPRRMYVIVAAIIRRGDRVMLVSQRGPHEPTAGWTLPGGVVEPGELVTEALVREVREETGLEVTDPGWTAYVVQTDDRVRATSATIFTFDIAAFTGTPRPADPDGFVLEARFVPLQEACAKASCVNSRARGEPLVAYLRSEVDAGAIWAYRREVGGEEKLVALVPGPRGDR